MSALDETLSAPPPPPVRLHPNLSELYRRKVTELAATLSHPKIRTPALEIVRCLIERVTVRIDGTQALLDLEGALSATIETAQPGGLNGVELSSVKVVAGARRRRVLRVIEREIPRLVA